MAEGIKGHFVKFFASSALSDALYDSPLLMLFVLPWTLTFLFAFVYIEEALLGTLFRSDSFVQLLAIVVGILLASPWLLLIGKSMSSIFKALGKMHQRRQTWRVTLAERKAELEPWIPKKSTDLLKIIAAIVVWSVASFPFTMLVTQMLEDRQVMIALFLALLLVPYWLLALGGIYVLIVGCIRICMESSKQSEVFELTQIESSESVSSST